MRYASCKYLFIKTDDFIIVISDRICKYFWEHIKYTQVRWCLNPLGYHKQLQYILCLINHKLFQQQQPLV